MQAGVRGISTVSPTSKGPSRDDLFFALAEEGFRKLFAFTNAELPARGDPLAAIRDGFLRYDHFSRQDREYFELMLVDRTVPRIGRNWQRFAFVDQMIGEVCDRIRRAVDAGQLPASTDPAVALHVLQGAVHGSAVLPSARAARPTKIPACWRETPPRRPCAPASSPRSHLRDTMHHAAGKHMCLDEGIRRPDPRAIFV